MFLKVSGLQKQEISRPVKHLRGSLENTKSCNDNNTELLQATIKGKLKAKDFGSTEGVTGTNLFPFISKDSIIIIGDD